MHEQFEVHAVADVDGARIERREPVTATLPTFTFSSNGNAPSGQSLLTFEGVPEKVCGSTNGATIVFIAKFDGAEVPIASPSSNCVELATPQPGELTIEAHLARPDRVLAVETRTIWSLNDVTEIEVDDYYWPDEGLAAALSNGKYFLSFTAYGTTSDGSGLLPSSTSHIEGARAGTYVKGASGTSHGYAFDVPPPAGTEVVIEARTRTLRIPIRAVESCR